MVNINKIYKATNAHMSAFMDYFKGSPFHPLFI